MTNESVDHTCDYNAVSKAAAAAGLCKPMASFDLHYDDAGLPKVEDCLKNQFVNYMLTPEVAIMNNPKRYISSQKLVRN